MGKRGKDMKLQPSGVNTSRFPRKPHIFLIPEPNLNIRFAFFLASMVSFTYLYVPTVNRL